MVVYRNDGDAIVGERIACQCRKYSGPRLIRGSGEHRANLFIFKIYAYCVIEKPLIRTN